MQFNSVLCLPCLLNPSLQRIWRGHKARVSYRLAYRLVLQLQSMWRGRTARHRFDTMRRFHATIVIQNAWRCFDARCKYTAQRQAALVLQTIYRVKVRQTSVCLPLPAGFDILSSAHRSQA